jgi:HTH-type transcriptional regulator, sugar sensing transcriptional regulator
MKEYLEALKLVDLSDLERKVYLDLLSFGESKSGDICKRTKIHNPNVYGILNKLLDKGLITYKIINNIKSFNATNPETLQVLFTEKEEKIKEEKKNLMEYIKQLKKIQPMPERLNDFKFFQGIRGIKSLYTEISDNWHKNEFLFIASAPIASFQKLEGFFVKEFHKKRIEDNVNLKMLINSNSKKWGTIRSAMPLTKIKYLDIDTKTEYGIINEFFYLISYDTQPYGLLIKDKNFTDTYKAFFNIMWKVGKE